MRSAAQAWSEAQKANGGAHLDRGQWRDDNQALDAPVSSSPAIEDSAPKRSAPENLSAAHVPIETHPLCGGAQLDRGQGLCDTQNPSAPVNPLADLPADYRNPKSIRRSA